MTCALKMVLGTVVVLAVGCTPGGGSDDGPGTTSSAEDSDSTVSATTATDGATMPSEDDSSGGSTTPDPDSSGDGPGCGLPPVDEDILNQLFIEGGGGFVAAGGGASLYLAWIDAGFPMEVDACVEWSIDPVEGVSIDSDGDLSVDAAVPLGTTISVTADVEAGRRILDTTLEVYEPLESPILGFWSELMQLPCDGGAPFMPEPIIYDTGEFTVTWTPFEVYIDYWGTFTHDVGTGALSLTVTGGNYVPDDVDGEGIATVTDGQLTLQDMWLGTAQDPVTPAACGHVFE